MCLRMHSLHSSLIQLSVGSFMIDCLHAERGQLVGRGVHAAGQHDHSPHGGRGVARQVRCCTRRGCTGPCSAAHTRTCQGRCACGGSRCLPSPAGCNRRASTAERRVGPPPPPPCSHCSAATHLTSVFLSFPCRALLRCHPPPNMHKMVELSATAAELGFELDTSGAGGWPGRLLFMERVVHIGNVGRLRSGL